MTAYTHYKNLSFIDSLAKGSKGSEISLDVDQEILNGVIDDISASGSNWLVSPYAGTIEKIYTVIDAAITTAAAATLSFELTGTAITGAGISVALGSAAGAVDSSTPTALNTVTAGQAVELITNGGSTNASKAEVTMILKRT